MSVPASINDLSTTAASNSPAGSEPVFPQLDDHLRFGYSCIAYLRDNYLSQAASPGTITVTATGVGIGTATPSTKLHAVGSAVQALFQDSAVFSAGSNGGSVAFAGLDSGGTNRTFSVVQGISEGSNTGGIKIQTRNSSGVLTDALTINSAQTTTAKGGLAVAGSGAPTAGAGVEVTYGAIASTGRVMAYDHTGGTRQPMVIDGSTVAVYTGGTQKAIVDSSGNIGVGVTPSGWGSYTALDLNTYGALASSTLSTIYFANGYFNGTNYIYKASAQASMYVQTNGSHQWYNAPSGTAGTAISFTQAMTLDTVGNLGLGVTPLAWYQPSSPYKTIQIGVSGAIFGRAGHETIGIGSNLYATGTNAYAYALPGGYASLYIQASGVHQWYSAPSGTAGNPITFTQAMALDTSSNLSVTGKVTAGADATAAGDLVRFGQLSGRLLNVQTFYTAGSSTYTPTAGTKAVLIDMIGGGGGSGWAGQTTSGQAAVTPAGSHGYYQRIYIPSGITPTTVTIGAGGAGGVVAKSVATAGGTTSFGSIASVGGGSPSSVVDSSAVPFIVASPITFLTYTLNTPAVSVIAGSPGEQAGADAIALSASVTRPGYAVDTPLGNIGQGGYGVTGTSSSGTNGNSGCRGGMVIYEFG